MSDKPVVYFFGEGNPGQPGSNDLLGGKGYGLGVMTNLGLPVPKGFTIPTTMCRAYMNNNNQWPEGLAEEIDRNLERLQAEMGKKFGSEEDPLLVSVRSGAAISMPGMMDTVLNLGLNDKTVIGLANKTHNERFAWDSYRRFLQMFGNVVMQIDKDNFEQHIIDIKKEAGVKLDTELNVDNLKELVKRFRGVYVEKTGKDFPQDHNEQLKLAINAVFRSWNNPEAITYRRINKLEGVAGTAVNVQAMVFGNKGDTSGTGVAFTRDPVTGENRAFGEFLPNAQGEDVVAGIRTPIKIDNMKTMGDIWPRIHSELMEVMQVLFGHYKDMVDLEFTIEEGKLWMLQSRKGKRTGAAMIRIAVDLVDENVITEQEAILRTEPGKLNECLFPRFDSKKLPEPIGSGLGASPGASTGKIVFTPEEAIKRKGEDMILVRRDTSPEDIEGMDIAKGILTQFGGATSHAAVVARGMGKCCVCGASCLSIDYEKKTVMIGEKLFHDGDVISIDGTTGKIYEGDVPRVPPALDKYFNRIMEWADKYRRLRIRTNADTPNDAKIARDFGAEGIGLTRTEHMFFENTRILRVRKMILAETTEERIAALKELEPYQRDDFIGIFRAMDKLPVNIRFLDPPLHEFLPHEEEQIKELSEATGKSVDEIRKIALSMKEMNPMLGFRGCRLGVVYPEITKMQVRAIMQAACEVKKEGIEVHPEMMLPLIFGEAEFNHLRQLVVETAEEVLSQNGMKIEYHVGTMLELPRACIRAGSIAKEAEYFSFGTNDLTQTTFGISRDDGGKFLDAYIKNNMLKFNPFESLDTEGVGYLMNHAVTEGRKVRPGMKCGICGEQTDPRSIQFLHDVGLTYVSCSPYRVPVARLAAAKAALSSAKI